MGNVEDLDAYRPHECFESICLHCLDRSIIVVPLNADPMKDWPCAKCGKTGGMIRTGQPLKTDKSGE